MKHNESYKRHVLLLVISGTMMAALDASIVNISIPTIMTDFNSSLDEVSWVITSYMLAFAALMPLTGWLRDRVGHKMLFMGSLAVFTIGSLLCGLAGSLPFLIIARVIQAIGGGAITPTGMALLTDVYEPEERGKAFGYWGMGAILGPVMGPTVGGFLTQYFGWPSIFLINIPIGIIAIFYAAKILRPDKPPVPEAGHPKFDILGFLLLATFIISFLLCMSEAVSLGWSSSFVINCAIISCVAFVLFIFVESKVEKQIMDLSLFKNPIFAACFSITALRSLAIYGGTFLLPVFLQNYKKLGEVESGLLLLPGSIAMACFMPIAGRAGARFSARTLALMGFCGLVIFFLGYSQISVEMSSWSIIWPTLFRGLGVALLSAPLNATALNSIPTEKAGMGSSMINIVQQVGGSMGIALLGLLLQQRTVAHIAADPSSVNWAHILGFRDAFIGAGLLSLLGLLLAFKLPAVIEKKKKSEQLLVEPEFVE